MDNTLVFKEFPRTLVLGASGMIGSTISSYLYDKTLLLEAHRKKSKCLSHRQYFLKNVEYESLSKLIFEFKPDYVINCIGLTKHLASLDSLEYFYPNILIPRYLKRLKIEFNFMLIHISSDCVFNGKLGNYSEKSVPDSLDFYGLTKAISESDLENHAMILRTSTVGYEQDTNQGLVEWFLHSDTEINGYSRAFFNGVTTLELAKVIGEIISKKIVMEHGIFHVTGNKISKFDFLLLLNDVHKAKKNIQKDNSFFIDRTLNKSKKIHALDRSKSSWKKMLIEMKDYRDNEIFK